VSLRPHGAPPQCLLVFALLWFAVAAAPRARAGTEEFSTFTAEGQEEDDESLIDHLLNRPPREWVRQFEHASQAIRTSQGCLTSGQWIEDTDLKLRAPLGKHAYFGFNYRTVQDDRQDYQFVDLSFHFPTRAGTFVGMFRPFHDKSNQDFAFMYELGADTTTFQMRLVAGFEDAFNNFWAFRQTRVGGLSEPYLKHPYEPGAYFILRKPNLRAEVGGRWLTPGTKEVAVIASSSQRLLSELWGTYAYGLVEAKALGLGWEVRSLNHQAASSQAPVEQPEPDARDFRRQWNVETAVSRQFAPKVSGEVRWLYQERTQNHHPPVVRTFFAIDRVIQAETVWHAHERLVLRLGGLYDRITIAETGAPTPVILPTYGSRIESRLYFGAAVRFANVSLLATEGIELDPEPYDVVGLHDKAFLQLLATF
jgi:hypothetical protein